MEEVSQNLKAYLLSCPEFTSVMVGRVWALAAPGDAEWPFSIFRIREENGETKDGDSYLVTLSAHFKPEKYAECVRFLDAMKPLIKSKYDWISSEPDINEEDLSYMGFINFKINQ